MLPRYWFYVYARCYDDVKKNQNIKLLFRFYQHRVEWKFLIFWFSEFLARIFFVTTSKSKIFIPIRFIWTSSGYRMVYKKICFDPILVLIVVFLHSYTVCFKKYKQTRRKLAAEEDKLKRRSFNITIESSADLAGLIQAPDGPAQVSSDKSTIMFYISSVPKVVKKSRNIKFEQQNWLKLSKNKKI